MLVGPDITATRTATTTTVVVTGHAESVVGLFSLPVQAVASGPTENYAAPAERHDPPRPADREETGSVVAELVLLTPLLILVLLFVVALGRLAGARIDVDGAAAQAARAASIARDPATATAMATQTATAALSDPTTSPALSSASALIPPSSSLADW